MIDGVKMVGKGIVRITNELISEKLKFPDNWTIERINTAEDNPAVSVMVVSGEEFPEVTDKGEIKKVRLIPHEDTVFNNITFEVQEI